MTQDQRYFDLPLEDVIGDRFGRYSKYIIQDRALPDVRDGLKPVQRRILYSMFHEGNIHDKPFRKSAKTVGNVIGNYHPHGDSSVYEAMVRMSQDWKLRNMLIEMHGNNGSVDGDPPAAMRYTEARLSSIASELLRNLEQNTVDFIPNFDDSTEEPTVLPGGFPNLLVNGATGISAGYATEIPPHCLKEIIDGVILRIDKPSCSMDDLMSIIKGPDFPGGGIIQGIDGIRKAYETGKGKIIIRSKTAIEPLKGGKQQIVITEIPYEVNKANLVKKIDEIRFDKKIDGIIEVRDETDRTGLRIVIELKKEVDSQTILNFLYKNTDLQVPYNFNMVAIYNRRPKLLSLFELLDAYIAHQKEVVLRRSKFQLDRAKNRQHIVDGLMKALSILDQVIAAIRASSDKKDAKNNLMSKFEFTEIQAEAIVTLQLYRLTNTDITQLREEASSLEKLINELLDILNNENKLLSVIKSELKEVRKKFGEDRRSIIENEIEEIQISKEAVIPLEDVIVTVTNTGYIKRTSVRSYSASNGKDFGVKEGDFLVHQINTSTTSTILLFTNQGNYLFIPVYDIPDIRWKDMGQHVSNIVQLDKDEIIIGVINVNSFDVEDTYVMSFTKNGLMKKTDLTLYKVQRYSKSISAINLKDDDELIKVTIVQGNCNIFLTTSLGYSLWFNDEDVNPIGVKAAGVKAISLKENDTLVAANTFEEGVSPTFVVITQRGAGKKIQLSQFEKATRAKRGVVILRELKSAPHRVVAVKIISQNDELIVTTEKNAINTFPESAFKMSDRYSNGSFFIDTDETGFIKNVYIVSGEHKQQVKSE
ncbi:MAG: gyrase subunit [Bacillales bacterium]|jgi:topoisomerase-4 subunit A|nr:gyrase subunit [Bacillales bacterium]